MTEAIGWLCLGGRQNASRMLKKDRRLLCEPGLRERVEGDEAPRGGQVGGLRGGGGLVQNAGCGGGERAGVQGPVSLLKF